MRIIAFATAILLCASTVAHGQHVPVTDSVAKARSLDSVVLIADMHQQRIRQLPMAQGLYIFAAKKTEVIEMAQLPADIANKNARQIFAKIPGVFVYDMDGPGNQVNIATRGLDPHRGWEFNTRKDGLITNSDMYGYPASHYSMPMESIGRVEIVRGTGSLQYGAQFGGMLNYISKQGDTTRPISGESINTAGSFGLVSTYNAIGGKTGRLRYYAYLYKKSRNGYRDHEHTESEAQSVRLTYEMEKFSIHAEWSRSKYQYRIPGPLNDSMFHADPRQATRSRNYFSPDIHIPGIRFNWQPAASTKVSLVVSGVLGKRNSVLFDKPVSVRDTINASTMQYNSRQVDIDRFNSYTAELRVMQEYELWNKTHTLAAGVQYMNNDLHRTQLGKGTTGSDYDLALVDPVWGRDVHLKTNNLAFFAENKFQLTDQLVATLGARVEMGKTDMSGTIHYYPDNAVPLSIRHRFPLLGAGLSYKMHNETEWYAGWSQAYHPMLFKDLIPASLYEKVDPAIKDAKGSNIEIGYRGNWKLLRWDITGFMLHYNNRFGTLATTDNAGVFYTYRTNIGHSLTKGVEALIQADWLLSRKASLSLFTSTALMDARYTRASIKMGTANVDIRGNKVESAPSVISRNGISMRYQKANLSVLYSITGKSYADAANTVTPMAGTGAVGLVPGYSLLDLHGSVRITRSVEVKVSINNVMDKQYFTKRPTFYPGPGIWPSEGRNYTLSAAIRI